MKKDNEQLVQVLAETTKRGEGEGIFALLNHATQEELSEMFDTTEGISEQALLAAEMGIPVFAVKKEGIERKSSD